MHETTSTTDRPTLTTAERRAILSEYDSYVRPWRPPPGCSAATAWPLHLPTRHIQRVNRGTTSLEAQRPGPVPQPHNPLADEVARLTKENARLQAKLA